MLNNKMEYLKTIIRSVERIHAKKRELGDAMNECVEKPQSYVS
jgi:hypothetical protein